MREAIIVHATPNTAEVVTLPTEEYDYIKGVIGGWLEAVRLDGATMYLNEEGKLLGLPPNEAATALCRMAQSISPYDHIVGDVVLVGEPDRQGNDTGLKAEVQDRLLARLLEWCPLYDVR